MNYYIKLYQEIFLSEGKVIQMFSFLIYRPIAHAVN